MKSLSFACALTAFAALCATGTASAQSEPAPAGRPTKQIGQARNETVPSLIVLNARGATLTPDSLVLSGVSANAIIFADRPVRSAGHALTAHLLDEWNDGKDSFGKDPPNATVSVFDKDGKSVRDAVVVLKAPKMEGDKVTFAVDLLEGDLSGADGPASVFIDIIGMPFTPMSYAGVARRTARRGAFYAAAAAPYYRPYYPPAPYYRPYYPPPMPYYRPY